MKTFLSILSLCALLVLPGQAQAYSVGLNPADQTIFLGTTAPVDINLVLTGTEALFGFDLALTFDPALVGFDSFSTSLLDPSDPFNPLFDYLGGFTFEPTVDPTVISFSGTFLPWDVLTEPLSGSFTLASLNFTGIGLGTSPLTLTGELDLGNAGLDPVNVAGSVTVAPVPEPGTFLLLGLGLAGIVGYRRRFNRG
ncbi:hypothetical protein DSOUD_3092 [Desulfuromonas soudanensis]|uniref:Ice-binding protein C-terminal domain-containing protein n=1 Tax=Desulfuromonas soudanensis TaxID=1603606 RepID=A0A0M4DBN6_9BACT|nr:cohesin domain-containing protein [Desulfuromonas soudanensis]ALC17817.1 hypothetical protein DSOUD_3092 [Desulfuromonas soudanensis]